MSNDILIVNAVAAVLIIFVYWWFFGSTGKPQVSVENETIQIVVKDGVYFPSMIQVPAGKPIKLTFLRKDMSECAGVVNFPQLNMSYELPVNKQVEISLPPMEKGEVDFVCPMRMYKGRLVVT